jgi:2-polyprenyl-3-methyl-5-hydroxy-6-metoxy-1,4-benzoquinol methylase
MKSASTPRILLAVWSLAWLLVSATAHAQEAPPAEKKTDNQSADRYTFRRIHDPNGIGKFYMGREIAHVMGHQAIDWLERPQREEEERLTLLMEALKLKPGMQVADIGAGSGVISVMIANRIGDGNVFAVDIQKEMLDALEAKCRMQMVKNVEPVLGTTQSPRLAAGSIDLAVMVDVYHEFDFPYEMLKEIVASLKPGGRVAFVEYRKEDPTVPIKLVHKMTEAQIRKEAGLPEFGLTWTETVATLPRQHVVIFTKGASK